MVETSPSLASCSRPRRRRVVVILFQQGRAVKVDEAPLVRSRVGEVWAFAAVRTAPGRLWQIIETSRLGRNRSMRQAMAGTPPTTCHHQGLGSREDLDRHLSSSLAALALKHADCFWGAEGGSKHSQLETGRNSRFGRPEQVTRISVSSRQRRQLPSLESVPS